MVRKIQKNMCENSGYNNMTLRRLVAAEYYLTGEVDIGKGDTLFTQLFHNSNFKIELIKDKKGVSTRCFEVRFIGEGSEDAGGPYRELWDSIAKELMGPSLPVLVPTENQKAEHGAMRSCFILNHANKHQLKQFGWLLAYAINTGQPMLLDLHPIVWKQICGVPLKMDDLCTSDR